MFYDISPRVTSQIPVWPGDAPFSTRLTWSIAEGASVNVSAITTTPHLGAHVDAPLHTEAGGVAVDELPIERFWGLCWVVETAGGPLVEPGDLANLDLARAPRVLFRTGTVADRSRFPEFPEQCAALSVALVEEAARRGVILLGLDTPSVDPIDSKTLAAHHALNQAGISNLEGLVLDGVPAGLYELVALPLRLAGLDASPVRAVLRST